jgi:pimeloyl-ACP methyl ester carboxylesterase
MPDVAGMFEKAYEAVLRTWPGVEVADLAGPYGTTRVLSSGPPDGPPLVLLPGGGATATAWFANAPALSALARVHAVDLPGTAGGTAVSVRDAAGLCRWLDSVLDVLAGGPVDLAGHSYGGWVALTYALHAPARVRRLALLDPTQCFAGFRPGYLVHALPVLVRPSRRTAAALRRWETGGRALDPVWTALADAAAEAPKAGKLVTRPKPDRQRLRRLDLPTLVLLAGAGKAQDAAKAAAAARASLPDVRIEVLPTATHHTLPLDPAAEVNRALLAFFTGRERG